MTCYLFSAPIYFLFSSDIPALLYYSHIPTASLALIVGLFVFFQGRKNLLNQLLLLISLCFATWIFINLILWTNINADVLLFSWSLLRLFSSVISILCVYFIYVFIDKKDTTFMVKSVFLVLLAPVIFLAPMSLNLGGLDLVNCDAYAYENQTLKLYHFLLGVLAMVWIFVLLVRGCRAAVSNVRKQIMLIGIGVEFFLFSFFTVVFLVGYLVKKGLLPDSGLEMYGMFGILVFFAMVGYLITASDVFSFKIISAEALSFALVVLVASEYAFVQTKTNIALVTVTLILTVVLVFLLVQNIRKEIENREKGERLARYLANANARLRELDKQKTDFVSIASHQLRSPIAAIKGYTSLITDGSYGDVPEKLQEPLHRVLESGQRIGIMVDDFLNITRIEQGRMTYNMAPQNICTIVETVIGELRVVAEEKGLSLSMTCDNKENFLVKVDEGKMKQIFSNLIDNSIKYTPTGSITVAVLSHEPEHKMLVKIQDTGIGVAPEEISNLFQKFNRASNANEANVLGTGLGLYIAREIMKAHGGWINVQSEGLGKGSTFTVELPIYDESTPPSAEGE